MDSDYPQGLDVVWIATDGAGSVAAFITAGEGPIPKTVLASEIWKLADCEAEVLALPISSEATIFAAGPKPDSYRELAATGMFVYDWTDIHKTRATATGAYELVAVPLNAIALSGLPAILQQFAALASLRGNRFGRDLHIDMSGAVPCHYSATCQ